MSLQMPIDYFQIFTELNRRRAHLTRQRDEAEIELAKLKQLILSTFSMLSEDQQKANQQAIDDIEADSSGLQDAIKLVFSTHKGEWLTLSNVRDFLSEIGFDFRHYKGNALSSISTTLKRMTAEYLEIKNSGSGALYCRRLTFGDRIAEGSATESEQIIGGKKLKVRK
jgi:hypothetical protein